MLDGYSDDMWAEFLRNWYRPTTAQSGEEVPVLSLVVRDDQMPELAAFLRRGWVDAAAHPNMSDAHVYTLTAIGRTIVYGTQQAGSVH